LEAGAGGLPGADPAGRLPAGDRRVHLHHLTRNQIIAGGVTFFVCLLLWLLSWFTAFDSTVSASQVVNYLSIVTHFENFSQRACSIPRTSSSTLHDFLRAVHHLAIHGIAAVEVLT
jgi:hypothetical protein